MSQITHLSPEFQQPHALSDKSVSISSMAITPASPAQAHRPAPFNRLVTTHEPCPKSGTPKEDYHGMSGESRWQQITPNAHFSLIYTTSEAKPEMSQDADVASHEALLDSGKLSLTHAGADGAGSVCRAVEFAPRNAVSAAEGSPYMHRTQSLDYGIVVKGQIELLLPDQPPQLMNVGDVAVQRGTNHAWRNVSTTEPARMIFVLMASEKITFDGKDLGEVLPDQAGRTKEALHAKRT